MFLTRCNRGKIVHEISIELVSIARYFLQVPHRFGDHKQIFLPSVAFEKD